MHLGAKDGDPRKKSSREKQSDREALDESLAGELRAMAIEKRACRSLAVSFSRSLCLSHTMAPAQPVAAGTSHLVETQLRNFRHGFQAPGFWTENRAWNLLEVSRQHLLLPTFKLSPPQLLLRSLQFEFKSQKQATPKPYSKPQQPAAGTCTAWIVACRSDCPSCSARSCWHSGSLGTVRRLRRVYRSYG